MNSISRSKGGLGWVNSYSKVRVTNEIKEISVCQGKKNTTRKNDQSVQCGLSNLIIGRGSIYLKWQQESY